MRSCTLRCRHRNAPGEAHSVDQADGTVRARRSAMDFVAVLIALGFFAASWGLAGLCERLGQGGR